MTEKKIRELVKSMNQIVDITSKQEEMIIQGILKKSTREGDIYLDKISEKEGSEWTLINIT